jgi:uncharacterized protein involved in outer membrane biogenesis
VTLRRIIVGAVAAIASLVVLAAIALAVLLWQFNPNAYKGRIEAALHDATGLNVHLNGHIGLAWAIRPTITMADVVVQNPPGFTAPDLARIERLTVRLDLPALVHRQVVVDSLTVQHPQLALEINKAGLSNWQRPRPAPAAAPKAQAAKPSAPAPAGPRPAPFTVHDIAVHDIAVNDLALTYHDDRTGKAYTAALPTLRLTAASATAPMKLVARGQANGRAFDLNAQSAPMGQVLGGGSPLPLRATLHVTGSDEDVTLTAAAPGETQPVHLTLTGQYLAQPIALTADLGSPGKTLSPQGPIAVKLSGQAAGSSLSADGTVGDPAHLAGVDLVLNAASPDLGKLAVLLGTRLPDLRAMKFAGRLHDAGGLGHGFTLSDLSLTSQQGDMAGTLAVTFVPRTDVKADLHGARLDLAALQMVGPPPNAVAQQAAAHPAPPPAPASVHVIPDTPLPFDALRREDATLKLRFGTLQAEDASFTDFRADANLQNGTLGAKIHGVFKGGAADVHATIDARPATPTLALIVNAPALPMAQLLHAFRAAPIVSGDLAIAANLHGAGQTPHLIAATLTGSARLSMEGGTISTKLLEKTLGPAVARANPLAVLGNNGDTTRLRCFALRGQAANGQVRLDPLLVSSDLLTVSGSGSVNLASETLDLHLRPEGRAGTVQFSVPVTLSGSLRDPHANVQKGAPVQAILGILKGAEVGATAPSCASAIAAVNGTKPPPVEKAAKPARKLPNPAALLRQFLK